MADFPKIDEFSGLPFVLVIKIISFLTFSQAYKLCLLRPEWLEARLWRYCGAIDLHEKFHLSRKMMKRHLRQGAPERAREIKVIEKENFFHLVDKVICTYVDGERPKKMFSLQISFTSNLTHIVNNWLSIILSKHIKEITLDFADRDTIVQIQTNSYEVPNFFFKGQKWITIIRLFSCVIPNGIHFKGFTHLTTLVLHGIRFRGINLNDSVIGCAMLAKLFIVECFGVLKMQLGAEMKCLTELVVRNCEAIREGIEFIHTPNLEHFEYQGSLIPFEFSGTYFLDNVILEFVDTSYPYIFLEIDDYFSRIYYPRYFTITVPALTVTPIEHLNGLPNISLLNVDILTLKTNIRSFEIVPIMSILKNAKYMSTLIFAPSPTSSDMVEVRTQLYRYNDLPSYVWDPEYNAAMPLLERVEFGGFAGEELQMKMLSFILKHSKKLSKVVLKPRRGTDLRQFACPEEFQAMMAELGASSCVMFEWRYR